MPITKQEIILLVSTVAFGLCGTFCETRDSKLIKKAAVIDKQIQLFKAQHGRLPLSVTEIGLEEEEGGIDAIYYTPESQFDSTDTENYFLSYGTSLGESMYYYSDTKTWEEFGRTMKKAASR